MFVMTLKLGIKTNHSETILQQSDLVICCYHLEPQTCVLTGPLLMFPLQPQAEEDGDGEADMVNIALVSIAASSLQPPDTDTVLDKLTRFCNGTDITKYFCCRRTLYNVQAACTVVQVHTPPSSQCRNSSLLSKCRFMTPT